MCEQVRPSYLVIDWLRMLRAVAKVFERAKRSGEKIEKVVVKGDTGELKVYHLS